MEARLSGDRNEGRGGAWRTDATFMLVFAVFTLAIVSVDVFTVVHDRAAAGRPVSAWEPLTWEATSGLVLVGLLPFTMRLCRRWPPQLPPRFGWIAWHLPAAFLFSLVHVVAMGGLRWMAYAVVGAFYDPLGPLGDWPYELRKDLLVYAGFVAAYAIWRGMAGSPQSELAANAEPEAIEVRAGARRLFVPIGDILWVEAAGNYVELHRGAAPVLHRAPLAQMERRLARAGFVRIHRSRLVRLDAIAAVETRTSGDFVVRLVTGQTLSGSRRFRAATRLDRGAAAD